MQKWTGHVQMMSNIISNLIVFEIFASDHEYLRFCVCRSSCSLPDPKLKVYVILVAPLFPSEAYYLLLSVRSNSQIVPRENTKRPPPTTHLVVVSRSKPPSTTPQ